MDRIDSTVTGFSVNQFLRDAGNVGHCFRCGVPVDPTKDEWATLAQASWEEEDVRGRPGNEYLIGGVLCEPCVESWREWVEDGYAVEPIVPDGALDHRGLP